MASHDTEVADGMKQHGIRPTSTRAEVIQAWDRAANPMRGWIEWNIKRHRDEAARLRTQGFTLSEGDQGVWVRKN
jgi:hypothetical protein